MSAVVITSPTFATTASVLGTCDGIKDLPIAVFPGAFMSQTDNEIREIIENTLVDQIIASLTKKPESAASVKLEKSVEPEKFSGTYEEINELYYNNGWTDGLPITLPTPEKIREFLQHTGLKPDEIIAKLPQAQLGATPRNVAANTVMAGCKPDHLPLLIAAVQAIGDPDYNLMSIGTTAGLVPWLLVNGPIIKKTGIKTGVGLVSRGPNPAIGRAFRLILNNIAGFRPGETWMGTWGYFQPFVLAEDNDICDEIGWEPFHVSKGFGAEESTMTASSTFNWGPQLFPQDLPQSYGKGEVEPLLNAICKVIRGVDLGFVFSQSKGLNTVLITPSTAKLIARYGFSKNTLAEYLWENTRIRKKDLFFSTRHMAQTASNFPEGVPTLPDEYKNYEPDDMIPLLAGLSPKDINIIVCGDESRSKIMLLQSGYNKPTSRKIIFS